MEWGIIAVGGVFAVYLIYCLIKDWLSDRRFKSFARKSRDRAAQREEKKPD
jgi:hypothetical protein